MPSIVAFDLLMLSHCAEPMCTPNNRGQVSELKSKGASIAFGSTPNLSNSFKFSLALIMSREYLSHRKNSNLFTLPLFLRI